MCATSHPLAAQVAVETLKAGGNAMDAAIAGAVLLGICEPQMTGIGGDCFVLWSDAGGKINALNGSGRAPSALDAADLRAEGHSVVPPQSAHAVTIPGAIDAFCTLSERVGILGLDRLLAPAIHYAEKGIPVSPRVAFDWETDKGDAWRHGYRSEEHTSELQSPDHLVCRLLLEKKKQTTNQTKLLEPTRLRHSETVQTARN